MKIVEENKKKIIILETNEEIEVKTLKRNPISIFIKEKDGALLVDEVSVKRIKEIALEEEQVKILKEYNFKKKK
ncbi:TPA: hypothetical protein IAB29_04075 [Candidatus Ventrenecus stercoripullorum]|nr:hypothetical protein [Candidatus Ventrenecus stercoripullorum]